MTRSSQPSPPSNLTRQGRALWRKVTGAYELEDHELVLLAQACHTVDVIDQLETAIANDGVIAEGSRGQKVTHPAVDEIRLQRVTLARLLAALALPDSEGGRTVARAIRAGLRQATGSGGRTSGR